MFEGPDFFRRGFLLAAKHHGNAARRSKLDHQVRAFVGHPNIVVLVDLNRMGKRPSVEMVPDLAQEGSVRVEFQQLCGTGTVGWTSGIAARKYKDVMLGIQRHTCGFAQVKISGKL